MLVLSRKKNQSIVINNDITITVVEMRDDRVRLGIVAPRDVSVHRQEVYDAIHGKCDNGPEPVAVRPARPPAADLLPDLIVECQLAPRQGQPRFTAEGGFFFRDGPSNP